MLVSTMDHVSYSYYPVPKEDGYVDLSMHPHQRDAYAYGGPSPPPPHHGHPVTNTLEETSPKNGTKSSLYKTELCKRFSEFGSCRYGAKCQFAHGVNELRHVVRHPKYKTTKCKSYWGSGHCPYGSRCRFIHDETEALLAQAHQFGPPAYAGLAATSSSPNLYLHDPKQDPMALSMNSYQESYAPPPPSYLAPFERNAWASRSHPKLSLQKSMGDGQEPSDSSSSSPGTIGHTNSLQNMHLTDAGVSDPEGYPDFKDAIDALMKFSIDSDETEEKSGSKEELWKGFSGKDEAWSLKELNLDAPPFEDKDKEKKSESPRLSVFERFH